MINLEVNGQKASFITLTTSPLIGNIKVSLKIYSAVEREGVTVLDSKTEEYCFDSDAEEAFSFFLSKLSEAVYIQKEYLEAVLFFDYDSLYVKTVNESISRSFTLDLKTGDLAIHSSSNVDQQRLEASLEKIQLTLSEI